MSEPTIPPDLTEMMRRLSALQHEINEQGMGPPLTVDEYQKAAMKTAAGHTQTRRWYDADEQGIILAALGLAGEAGEFADHVKKWFAQGHVLDFDVLDKEAGDVAWYLARYAEARGVPLSALFQKNIDKLRARYPQGFDAAVSQSRYGYMPTGPSDYPMEER
jgi:NTP pyrophosphatase (non-canonical NTP hydrolase)